MIAAITSHFVYQYWSAFWIVSSTSSFKGRITAEVKPPLPLYRALRKRAGCATTKSCRTSWLNWENPQTLRKPLGCASNSSQVWSKCHIYIIIISSFFHTHKATFTFGPHNIWLFPNRPPSFSPVSGGKDAPKGVHLKWQKIGSVSSGLTQLGQSKPQTKIGFSQFTRMLKNLSGFKEDWSWFNFEWKLCTKQPRWYCHLPFLCLYNLWVPCQGASRWVLVFWLLSILWRFNSYEAENKDGGNELLPGKHCQDDGENGLNKQTTMRGKL